jgi:hypothetical protein
MPRTGHYVMGLLMFCMAFIFTMGLASFLQEAALARQQQEIAAAAPTHIEAPMVSMLPDGSPFRKASF